MTSLDFEVAFVRVRGDSTGIIDVSVDYGDEGKGLCCNLVQPPANLKPEGGISGRRVVEYVRSVNLDDFHHLGRTSEISERVRGECMLMEKTHILWGTLEKSLPCEHRLACHARDAVVPRETIVQGVRGDIDRVLVRSHDNIGMDRGLEGVVLFLVVEGLWLVIWISKAILMAVLDVLERKVWGSDVLEIIGARVGGDAGPPGEDKGSGVNIHRRRCVWEGEREGWRCRRARRGRSWWTVTVNGREGVLNKWYIGNWDRGGVGDHV